MKLAFKMIIIIILFICTAECSVQKYSCIGDLKCELGGIIHDCRVGYRTVGVLNSDSSNVIIYPTWFAGRSEAILGLLKPEKLFNPEGYFVIIFDALGNGVSSSPSNYEGNFPEITISDMVQAEFLAIKKEFGLKRILGAIGGSMGSMQVFEWIRAYPDFIQKAVPYVCTPQPSAFDLLVWKFRLKVIDDLRKLNADDKLIQSQLNMINILQSRTPDYYVENYERNEIDDFLNKEIVKSDSIFTIDNYYCQVKAMTWHDIFRFDSSFEEGAKKIQCKVKMIIVRDDHLVNPMPAIRFNKLIDGNMLILENNRGHLGVGYEIDRCRDEIEDFFAEE